MFSISVAFGAIAYTRIFRPPEAATKALDALSALPVHGLGIQMPATDVQVADDFGQILRCKPAPTAMLYEDLEASKLLHVEYKLHQVRIQAETQKRAEADASLRAGRGPAVLTPMAGMRNGGGF